MKTGKTSKSEEEKGTRLHLFELNSLVKVFVISLHYTAQLYCLISDCFKIPLAYNLYNILLLVNRNRTCNRRNELIFS